MNELYIQACAERYNHWVQEWFDKNMTDLNGVLWVDSQEFREFIAEVNYLEGADYAEVPSS